METHARYVLVGLFSIVVIAVGFLFVYWLENAGQLSERAVYQIRYDGSVSGLREGAAVLFNGIRVGSVTRLRLNPKDPNVVVATVNVDGDAPVRPDTRAGIDFQGLLGAASVSLTGGTGSDRPKPGPDGEAPTLTADPQATRDLTGAARETLRQVQKVITDNADPLHETLANLGSFSDALARNSGRVDTILAGLDKMIGGGPPAKPPRAYGLTAPKDVTLANIPSEQLVVGDPVVPVVLDTQRILIEPPNGSDPSSEEGQWADSLPKLIQSKIIETFENGGYLSVGRPSDALTTDRQLLLEVRHFEVSPMPDPTAHVALTAKLVNAGTIEDAKVFRETAPVSEPGQAGAAAALDQAFGKVATDLVTWAAEVK